MYATVSNQWHALGRNRPAPGQLVLYRAEWRSTDRCPFIVAKLEDGTWHAPEIGASWSAQLDDLWAPIARCPR